MISRMLDERDAQIAKLTEEVARLETDNARLRALVPGEIAALVPQPPPVGGDGDVWAETIERFGARFPDLVPLMSARRAQGIALYGGTLRRGAGRDHDRDAAQEALDLAVYLVAARRYWLAGLALETVGMLDAEVGR